MVQERHPPLPAIPVRARGGAGPAALLATYRAGAEALLATARRNRDRQSAMATAILKSNEASLMA